MENNFKYIQILTAVATRKEAEKIAGILIKKRLAACVQIVGPITSVYKWKGKTEKSKEWLCLIKTKINKYKAIEKEIKKTHSYELPEIIAAPIIKGSKKYLSWIDKELK